jgi:hypothetical protein
VRQNWPFLEIEECFGDITKRLTNLSFEPKNLLKKFFSRGFIKKTYKSNSNPVGIF